MDFATVIQKLNWLAVIAAALSTFMIGGIWYSVFDRIWRNANHFSGEEFKKRNMAVVFGLSFVFSFLMALNLALFIGQEDVVFGMIAGFMTGFGWVALAIAIISLFESRPLSYVLINGGYMVVAFTVMGTILGAWK